MSALSRAILEARVVQIIDACKNDTMSEDSSVELKSEWPTDFPKCARRLAGHANAASDNSVLWIIGVDPKRGIVDFEPEEIANWYPQVCKHFDGTAPAMITDYRFDLDDGPVHVIQFDTTGRPYVFKASPEQFEVPWRRGTRVQSATRHDLLNLLLDRNRRLPLEYKRGAAILGDGSYTKGNIPQAMPIDLVFYCQFDPRSHTEIVVPFHKCTFEYRFIASEDFATADHVRIEPSRSRLPGSAHVDPLYMDRGPNEVSIRGPGEIDVSTYLRPLPLEYRDNQVECRVVLSDMHGFECHKSTHMIDIVVPNQHQKFFSSLPSRSVK